MKIKQVLVVIVSEDRTEGYERYFNDVSINDLKRFKSMTGAHVIYQGSAGCAYAVPRDKEQHVSLLAGPRPEPINIEELYAETVAIFNHICPEGMR